MALSLSSIFSAGVGDIWIMLTDHAYKQILD